MKIQKLRLCGYKRFYDLTIDLGEKPARIVALVGPNGCGKSSVFDAIIFKAGSFAHIGGRKWCDYTYHSLLQNPGYDHNAISIMFDKGELYSQIVEKKETGSERTLISFRSSFRYNGELKVEAAKAVSDLRNNDYGAAYSSDIDQRIEQNYRRLQIYYNKYLNEQDCRPSEAKAHIIGELNAAIHNCLSIEIDSLGDIEAGQGTFYFKKEDTPIPFSYNVLSSGEKEVVDLLLDLYLRKDEYSDTIYLIDEPELHLNTAIQRKLLIEINKIVPDNCQIWVATHSIGFLRALQDELNDISQIIQFIEDNQWAAKAYTLTPMIKSRNNWRNLFSTALDDLTGLVSPKQIVYCEGRADPKRDGSERGFDAEVYNTIFGEHYPETLFVSSGGNTELDQRSQIALSILSKVFPDVEILVLKDRDMASGKPTTEHDRRIYLENNPSNHRVLNRFEIENYLFDKEVLRDYCTINGLAFDEATYDAHFTDIVNQNVKDEIGWIKSCCGISGSINAERFKKNLSKYVKPSMGVYSELENVIFHRG